MDASDYVIAILALFFGLLACTALAVDFYETLWRAKPTNPDWGIDAHTFQQLQARIRAERDALLAALR